MIFALSFILTFIICVTLFIAGAFLVRYSNCNADDGVGVISILLSFVIMVLFIFTTSIDWSIENTNKECVMLGYHEAIEKDNNFYCVKYGYEPDIIIVDISDLEQSGN